MNKTLKTIAISAATTAIMMGGVFGYIWARGIPDVLVKATLKDKSNVVDMKNALSEITPVENSIQFDAEGRPFITNSDGTTEYIDAADDGVDGDIVEQTFRGEYADDVMSFSIADGWYADASFGMPIVFDEETNSDMNVCMVLKNEDAGFGSFNEITCEYMENINNESVESGALDDAKTTGFERGSTAEGRQTATYSCTATVGDAVSDTTYYFVNGKENDYVICSIDLQGDDIDTSKVFNQIISTFKGE